MRSLLELLRDPGVPFLMGTLGGRIGTLNPIDREGIAGYARTCPVFDLEPLNYRLPPQFVSEAFDRGPLRLPYRWMTMVLGERRLFIVFDLSADVRACNRPDCRHARFIVWIPVLPNPKGKLVALAEFHIGVDESDSPTCVTTTSAVLDDVDLSKDESLRSEFGMFIGAMALANTPGVTIEHRYERDRKLRIFRRDRVKPRIRYHVLRIDPNRVNFAHQPAPAQQSGPPKALHSVRGHFRLTRLFGRGEPRTIWIPDHKRGKLEAGLVMKDYAITTGDDNGIPEAVVHG